MDRYYSGSGANYGGAQAYGGASYTQPREYRSVPASYSYSSQQPSVSYSSTGARVQREPAAYPAAGLGSAGVPQASSYSRVQPTTAERYYERTPTGSSGGGVRYTTAQGEPIRTTTRVPASAATGATPTTTTRTYDRTPLASADGVRYTRVAQQPTGATTTTTQPTTVKYTSSGLGPGGRASTTTPVGATTAATGTTSGIQRSSTTGQQPTRIIRTTTTGGGATGASGVTGTTSYTTRPTQQKPSPTKDDDDVVEITTTGARYVRNVNDDVEIIDLDRDKVFDKVFQEIQKVDEEIEQTMERHMENMMGGGRGGPLLLTQNPQLQQGLEEIAKREEAKGNERIKPLLEPVWREFAREHKGEKITKAEFSELVRLFLTASKRSTSEDIEKQAQNMGQNMDMGGLEALMPPELLHMVTAIGSQMEKKLTDNLHEKMLSQHELIATNVWLKLGGGNGKDATVPKKAFIDNYLQEISEVTEKGLKHAAETGQLDDALGDLAVPMVIAMPIEIDMMMPQHMMIGEAPSAYGDVYGSAGMGGGYGGASSAGYGQQMGGNPYRQQQQPQGYQRQAAGGYGGGYGGGGGSGYGGGGGGGYGGGGGSYGGGGYGGAYQQQPQGGVYGGGGGYGGGGYGGQQAAYRGGGGYGGGYY